MRQPFNEEMVDIAHRFAALLRPMVETIDRFGLQARYLRKHKRAVKRFYVDLSEKNYQTSVATAYKKRFEKMREKLFTFLNYDSVSWNNNNAEHAIKAFARLRRVIRSSSTAKTIQEFLVLLSLSETCKYKQVDFFDFLRSGEVNLGRFADRPKTSTKARNLSDTVQPEPEPEPEPAAAAISVPAVVVKRGRGALRKVPGRLPDKSATGQAERFRSGPSFMSGPA